MRFAAECLAFSNVPESEGLEELFGDEAPSAHSPRYRTGVPRDGGAGWDFADVTDHYLEQLFDCRPSVLRYSDTERYFALARVTSAEMMERVIGLWRAEGSSCRGALVWLLRDLEPGAGAGILDSAGRPKAPYWFLKRACAARALWFTDEGLNGLRVHVHNDQAEPFAGSLRVRLLRSDAVEVASGTAELDVAGHASHSFAVDALLGRFTDATWTYRFGPCPYAIAVAELGDACGPPVATAHYLPAGLAHEIRADIGLHASASTAARGYRLRVETRELALFVRVSAPGFEPSDNYFHVPPAGAREIDLVGGGARPLVRVSALNARGEASVTFAEQTA